LCFSQLALYAGQQRRRTPVVVMDSSRHLPCRKMTYLQQYNKNIGGKACQFEIIKESKKQLVAAKQNFRIYKTRI
jgi:hypothetical protein